MDENVDDDADGDGYSECDGDCDDDDATVYLGAPETCDFEDEDCDGYVDYDYDANDGYLNPNTNKYDTFEDCGTCGNDCNTYAYDNADTICDDALDVPECVPDCLAGYHDANDDISDGCECEFLDANDEPFDGIDANCDGSDGDPEDAIHVSILGNPSGIGTVDDPLNSIQDGVDEAVLQGLAYVRVTAGVFYESVEWTEGINIIGGWDYFFTELDEANYPTTVDGRTATAALPGTFTLRCSQGLEQRLQAFIIVGTTAAAAGDSSYGVYLEDCDEGTSIWNNTVEGRPGADGDGGSAGDNGSDGVDGEPGQDVQWTDCGTPPVGGDGGYKVCGAQDVSGGDGGGTLCPISNGSWMEDGQDGDGDNPGGGGDGHTNGVHYSWACGTCYINANWGAGDTGVDGDPGLAGDGGDGCDDTEGSIVAGLFVPSSAFDGSPGTNGSGGGGGGSGSGAEHQCYSDNVAGGTGGGAGSGGCSAGGGDAAVGGGGSFGIFVHYNSVPASQPILDGNVVTADLGGDGGGGGDGGVGGDGGTLGFGGDPTYGATFCGRAGGDGGRGGDGGHGGGGGGGCGGPSYGLFVSGALVAADYGDDSSFSALGGGNGGVGGFGPGGTDGDPGDDGESGDKNF